MKNRYFSDQDNYYPSMVDMMAGILFIIIILLMGFIIEENVKKNDSNHALLEQTIDDSKVAIVNKLSKYLENKNLLHCLYLEDGSLIIPAKNSFINKGVELSKEANKNYKILSAGITHVLTQTETGKKAFSDGLINRFTLEVHCKDMSVEGNLLSLGRTISYFGALLTTDLNLMSLKNKYGHQILSYDKFTNNWKSINDYVVSRGFKNKEDNSFIVIRLRMFYPPKL